MGVCMCANMFVLRKSQSFSLLTTSAASTAGDLDGAEVETVAGARVAAVVFCSLWLIVVVVVFVVVVYYYCLLLMLVVLVLLK